MNRVIIFIFSLTAFSCSQKNKCKNTIESWKKSSSQKLEDFQNVDTEIRKFNGLIDLENYMSGELFLNSSTGVERIENKYKLEMPVSKNWFESGETGYISYKEDKITVKYAYQYCNSNQYEAYLYCSTTGVMPEFTQNTVAHMYDTLSLGNNWYYIVTECNGCGE